MTKNEDRIIDWRSTGRRKARRELYANYVPYECTDCQISTTKPPMDAPKHFEEIWPEGNRTLESQLQADHEDKNVQNNDIRNLKWRCPSHHKLHDNLSEKGQSTVAKESYF